MLLEGRNVQSFLRYKSTACLTRLDENQYICMLCGEHQDFNDFSIVHFCAKHNQQTDFLGFEQTRNTYRFYCTCCRKVQQICQQFDIQVPQVSQQDSFNSFQECVNHCCQCYLVQTLFLARVCVDNWVFNQTKLVSSFLLTPQSFTAIQFKVDQILTHVYSNMGGQLALRNQFKPYVIQQADNSNCYVIGPFLTSLIIDTINKNRWESHINNLNSENRYFKSRGQTTFNSQNIRDLVAQVIACFQKLISDYRVNLITCIQGLDQLNQISLQDIELQDNTIRVRVDSNVTQQNNFQQDAQGIAQGANFKLFLQLLSQTNFQEGQRQGMEQIQEEDQSMDVDENVDFGYDLGNFNYNEEQYHGPLFETLLNYINKGIPGFSEDDYRLVLRNQGITQQHLDQFYTLSHQQVIDDTDFLLPRIFPCVNYIFLNDMKIKYYDQNYYYQKMQDRIYRILHDDSHNRKFNLHADRSHATESIFNFQCRRMEGFIGGETRDQVNGHIEECRKNLRNYLRDDDPIDASCRTHNNIKLKFMPQHLKPFQFDACIFTDHVYLPEEYLNATNQRPFHDDDMQICPNCIIHRKKRVKRCDKIGLSGEKNSSKFHFYDFFFEQQLQTLFHDDSFVTQFFHFKDHVHLLKDQIASYWGSGYVKQIQKWCQARGIDKELIFQKNSISIDILYDGAASHEKSGTFSTKFFYFRVADLPEIYLNNKQNLHPLVYVPDFPIHSNVNQQQSNLCQLFIKRTFELFHKHGPGGIPLRIPIYDPCGKVTSNPSEAGNGIRDLELTVFLRVCVADAVARVEFSLLSGLADKFGCGHCLAIGQRIEKYNRVIQNNCKGLELIFQGLEVIDDDLPYEQHLWLYGDDHIQFFTTVDIHNYQVCDVFVGMDRRNQQVQPRRPRSSNSLSNPFIFNYRSYLADISNLLKQRERLLLYNQLPDTQKATSLMGYKLESFLGAHGTPIFLQYTGLGYIQGQIFQCIPIAHTVLHGICKDVMNLVFDESIMLKYQGNQKKELKLLQKEIRQNVASRWRHIIPTDNISKPPIDYLLKSKYKSLKLDQAASLFQFYLQYLFHEQGYDYTFERPASHYNAAQKKPCRTVLNILYWTTQIAQSIFYPEAYRCSNNEEVINERRMIYQNITAIYRFMENIGFAHVIKPNIHHFQCRYNEVCFAIGSLALFMEFVLERKLGVSKKTFTPQRYINALKHVVTVDVLKYQIVFENSIRTTLQVSNQLQDNAEPIAPLQPRNLLHIGESTFKEHNKTNINKIGYYVMARPINKNERELQTLFQTGLNNLFNIFAGEDQNVKPQFQKCRRILRGCFYQNQGLSNYVQLYAQAYINDNILYSSRMQLNSKNCSRFAFLDYSRTEKYVCEIYFFLSLRDGINQSFQSQLVDLGLLDNNQQDINHLLFQHERFLAVVIAFEAKKSASAAKIDDSLYYFDYNKPIQGREGNNYYPKFEIYPISSLQYPVFIADPNNSIRLNTQKGIGPHGRRLCFRLDGVQSRDEEHLVYAGYSQSIHVKNSK